MSETDLKIIQLDETSSTQQYFKENIELATHNFTVVRAIKQTEGYGRLNRKWQMQAGLDLAFSMSFSQPTLKAADLLALPLYVGFTILEVLNNLSKNNCHLKWPNDILFKDQKLAGVLVELIEVNSMSHAIIGIGLNINSENFSTEFKATSLKNICGKDFEIDQILLALVRQLRQSLSTYTLPLSQHFIDEYLTNSAMKNRQISFYHQGTPKKGKVVGLNSKGALLAQHASGKIFEIVDEITFI